MKKILLLIALVLVVAALGYMGASKVWGFPVFGFGPREGGSGQAEPALSLISLGQFMTNLVDSGRYIRISAEVEVLADKATSVTSRASEIKTDIYGLLRSKTFEELTGENGLRDLQIDILGRIETRCPGVAKNVFFSEFIVQ